VGHGVGKFCLGGDETWQRYVREKNCSIKGGGCEKALGKRATQGDRTKPGGGGRKIKRLRKRQRYQRRETVKSVEASRSRPICGGNVVLHPVKRGALRKETLTEKIGTMPKREIGPQRCNPPRGGGERKDWKPAYQQRTGCKKIHREKERGTA